MRRSLMRKELMEMLPVVLVAGVIYAGLLLYDIIEFYYLSTALNENQTPLGASGRWSALIHRDLFQSFWVVPLGFAVLLGLLQTISDSIQGTWGNLLHLPQGRRWVISTKLLAGSAAYLACSGLFVLGCVLLALSRQTENQPLQWWMVHPLVQFILLGMLLYLGAFLSGLRPARWYGSRLLPLCGCGMLAWGLILIAEWWIYGLLSLLVICGLLVVLILHLGESRDFS